MQKTLLTLQYADLKKVKLGLEGSTYYLKIATQKDLEVIALPEDLVQQPLVFELEGPQSIQKVEIWNYDTEEMV